MRDMPDTTRSTLSRRDTLSAIGYGVAIWIIATGLITILGPVLLPEAGSWGGVLLIVGFAALALGLAVVAYLLYRRTRADSLTLRLLFGTGIAATGLLLDAFVYAASAARYPLLSEAQQGPVAFFLVFAYGALLVAPHLTTRRPK